MRFTGQHVIITGASSGIGKATAERIVTEGGRVSLLARTAAKLAEASQALGPAALALPCDVGDQSALLAALDQAVTHHGPVDGLFLNAAAEGIYAPTPDYTDAALEEVLRVNAVSPFWAVRHLLPGMIARGRGAILVTGSLGAETGMVGNIGYLMAKHAVLGAGSRRGHGGGPARGPLQLHQPGLHRYADAGGHTGRLQGRDGRPRTARADRQAGRSRCARRVPVVRRCQSRHRAVMGGWTAACWGR